MTSDNLIHYQIKRRNEMRVLPDKPSALLRLALDDMKKCLGDADYYLDAMRWHEPNEQKDVCQVCAAGAVIAQTLKFDVSVNCDFLSDTMFDMNTKGKLYLINEMRVGYFYSAMTKYRWLTVHENGVPDYDFKAVQKVYKEEGIGDLCGFKGDAAALRFIAGMNKVQEKLVELGY
ncbi:MAG: hypothetical protein OXD01_05090 [Gammaproteobacteria bacterium]|nr:hypothetical protein [Gammaproteobacteria bacterium]